MIQFLKSPRFFLLPTATLLLILVLASCSTVEPTSTPVPSATPSARTTDTPEPPSATPEPQTDEGAGGVLTLPSATPAPTATPDVVTELVQQISESIGLQDVKVFRVSVDAWLDLGVSILLVLIFGFLLSRLVYFGLAKMIARTKNKSAENFMKQIRPQIYLFIFVLGFHLGTLRLPFIDVLVKQWLSRLYIIIYVVAATAVLWRLLDTLVEWYQTEIEPKRDRHQVDTILLLLHRAGRTLLVTISAIMLLSLFNINVNALIAAV